MSLIALENVRAKRWTIVSVDPEVNLFIEGQYQPEGTEDKAQPLVSAQTSPGSSRPSVQWVAGGARVVSFSGTFRSLDFLDDIRDTLQAVESLRELDPALGRAPRVQFTWGELEITGFVTECPTRIAGRWANGLPRAFSFSITLVGASPLGIDSAAPTSGETQFVHLKDGETFESLGARYYRQALKGELIRRMNPGHADQEEAGDRVKVLEPEHPTVRRSVLPTSPPFLDREGAGRTWAPVVEALALQRGQAGDLGPSWESLPEVISGEV